MGGKEKALFQFISRSDPGRLSFAICCLKRGGYFRDKLRERGVPFYEGLLRHRFDAFAFAALRRILRKERTDLIYTFSHPNTVIFASLARQLGLVRRVVVSYHAMGDTGGTRQVVPFLLPMLRRADALLAVAEIQKDYLVRVEGLPRERIRVVHNGVDTDRYRRPSADERAATRREFGFDEGAVVLVTVATLKALKRIDSLIGVAAGLRREGHAVQVLVVGEGPERGSLEALASRLGVSDHVVFAGMRDDVERVLRAADVFVLCSRTEAFPNVVLEAMATGLPVVATDVGSVREMVDAGESALVVDPNDDTALHAAVRDLVLNPARREAFGMRGRRIVEERFKLDSMFAKRAALIEELLAGTDSGGNRSQ